MKNAILVAFCAALTMAPVCLLAKTQQKPEPVARHGSEYQVRHHRNNHELRDQWDPYPGGWECFTNAGRKITGCYWRG